VTNPGQLNSSGEETMTEPPAGYARIEGTNRSPVPGATRVGPAEPTEQMSVSIRLRRRPDAPPLPDPSQAAPPGGGMSREEFAATYGADPADIARVEAFGSEHGLTVEETSIPRRTVVLAGTVEQMSDTFAVDLGRYQVGETSYRGREGHVHVPEELAPLVEGVFGLDNRQQARPLYRQAADPAQAVTALTPPQVAQLYDFPVGMNAAGQCVGVIEFGGGYHPADITTWFANHSLTPPTLADVGVDGATNSPGSGDDLEVILDIDVSGSVAQGARIAVYFAPWTEQGWVDVVSTAVHDATNNPSVISISWGWPEFETVLGLTWTAAAMDAVSTTFSEAALLGVTVFAASGDQGSDCQIGDGHAHVLYPTADPYLTSCGGTEIENVSGFGSFDEVLWNDNGASGGGVSDFFVVPSWQASADVPASVNNPTQRGRGVPDVAGNADPNSGYNLIQNGAQVGPVGGTSATAPLYAGLVALINAHLNKRVGYLNPVLYQKAETVGVFRDITASGTNAYNGAPGYAVGFGWDATTGLGSINGSKLLAVLRGLQLRTDIALTGVSGWNTIPVAFADGDGTWEVTNYGAGQFPAWAASAGVKVVTGDFSGNGRTDIALTGVSGWNTIPVAFANGDGTWTVTNQNAADFPAWAASAGAAAYPI
jgi:kumamolisin